MSTRERRVLDEARGFRAMTWIMAVMLFLMVLAAAAGLGFAAARRSLDLQLAGRLTVQVVEPDRTARDRLAARALAAARRLPQVRSATPVPERELAQLVRPWLGDDPAAAGLPLPAMIDVDAADNGAAAAVETALRRLGPAVRVDRQQRWMSPVAGVMATVAWLAVAIVALMLAATGAVVTLAARAGLEAHRTTIEIMHMLGSTDTQVAALFQRRIALDASLGGVTGTAAALAVILLVGRRVAALGSDLLAGVGLAAQDWAMLALVPLAFVALATVAARVTVLSALRRTL